MSMSGFSVTRKKGIFGYVTSCRFVFLWSVAWGIATMAISPIVNYVTPFLNPNYANPWTPDIYWRLVLYWHGAIFIPWITALAVVVCMAFGLNEMTGFSGRLVRDSVFIGGTIAVIIAMLNKPRETGLKVGLNYITVLLGITAALISAVMGHIAGWITWFGPWPSIVPQYINSTLAPSLGFYNSTAVITFTENAVASHSHLMLPSLMAGVVALVSTYYGYETSWSKKLKGLASAGFVVIIVSLIATIWVYIVSGVGNYSIPTLFTSANGVNGLAADDLLTGIIGFGALLVFSSLLSASKKSSSMQVAVTWRDLSYLSIIAAWLIIYLVIPVTGYYIEFHQTFYGGAGLSFDEAYTRFHQDFGFFVLPALVTAVLGLNMLGIDERRRVTSASLLLAGELVAFIFGEIYTMFSLNNLFLYAAIAGGVLMGLGASIGISGVAIEKKPTKQLVARGGG